MVYKCSSCGGSFDESDLEHFRGEEGNIDICPVCGGDDFWDFDVCDKCGEEFPVDELHEGFCESCILEKQYDYMTCYRYGAYYSEPMRINSFLAAMFSKQEVEEILLREIIQAAERSQIDCSGFIKDDISWFAEMMKGDFKR